MQSQSLNEVVNYAGRGKKGQRADWPLVTRFVSHFMPQFSFDIYVDNKIKMMSEIALRAVHERGVPLPKRVDQSQASQLSTRSILDHFDRGQL